MRGKIARELRQITKMAYPEAATIAYEFKQVRYQDVSGSTFVDSKVRTLTEDCLKNLYKIAKKRYEVCYVLRD